MKESKYMSLLRVAQRRVSISSAYFAQFSNRSLKLAIAMAFFRRGMTWADVEDDFDVVVQGGGLNQYVAVLGFAS